MKNNEKLNQEINEALLISLGWKSEIRFGNYMGEEYTYMEWFDNNGKIGYINYLINLNDWWLLEETFDEDFTDDYWWKLQSNSENGSDYGHFTPLQKAKAYLISKKLWKSEWDEAIQLPLEITCW